MADRMDSGGSPVDARVRAMARAVRARRKALRLTQIALSQLAGCGPDFVYDVEVGKTTLRLDKLIDLLHVLGLELVLSEGKEGLRVTSSLVPADRTARATRETGPPRRRTRATATRTKTK